MGDIYLDINGLSQHAEPMIEAKEGFWGHPPKKAVPYNENNQGIGLRYEWGDQNDLSKFVMAGGYRNSFDKDTYYAGGGFLKRVAGGDNYNLNVGAIAGGATGYREGVAPMAMPMVSAGIKDARVNLMYAPKTGDNPETYMLSMSYKLSADKERAERIKEFMVKKEE